MIEKSRGLQDIQTDKYGFQIREVAVAAMLKAYLQNIPADDAREQLDWIARPETEDQMGAIDRVELAELIEKAKAAAGVSALEWEVGKEERQLKKTIRYLREQFFPMLDGRGYVESMPAEMVEFLKDCHAAVAEGGK